MTNEQAKSELMQIYGSLSEEKKQALDVLMAQNCDQCEVGNPCLYCEHEFKAKADRNEFYNWDAPIRHKADGEYISRKALLEDLYKRDYTKFTHRDFVALVQYQDIVAIPPEHDGCKDCRYQDKGEDELPCRECQQNYKDMWEAKANKVGHWIVKGSHDTYYGLDDFICSECGERVSKEGEWLYEFCPRCGSPMEHEDED